MKKKTKNYIIAFALLAISVIAITPALAQPVVSSRVTMEELGGEPAIIGTNLFYGGKYLFSDVKGLFINSKIKKANFHFKVTDQIAADLLKLEQVAPRNIEAFNEGLSDYQRSVILSAASLNRLADADLRSSQWRQFADRAVIHLTFIDDVRTTHRVNQEQAILIDLEDTLLESLVRFLVRLDNVEAFTEGILLDNSVILEGFSDLRDSELLALLSEKAHLLSEVDAAHIFSEASETLFAHIGIRLWMRLADGDMLFIQELEALSGESGKRAVSFERLIELQPSLADTLLLR